MGGFAHLATLVKRLKASRPGALLLDGGDTWQGSATALWTKGQDMVDACKLLGVDVMTGHWEFTYGQERVKQVVEQDFKGTIEFVAQNVATADFNDPVFKPYTLREINGVHGRDHRPGVPVHADRQPALLRARLDLRHPGERAAEAGERRARRRARRRWCCCRTTAWTWTSSSPRRVTGIDAILGGHTHDAVPRTGGGDERRRDARCVTNAGSNGKFLGVLDLDVQRGQGARAASTACCRCSPTCFPPTREMAAHIAKARAPYDRARSAEKLAITEGLLYRRGNFNGTVDQVILDALMAVKGAEIAFSPGLPLGHVAAARARRSRSST